MNTTPFKKTGLETLLTPENSALILIDHHRSNLRVSKVMIRRRSSTTSSVSQRSPDYSKSPRF